jgi:pyridoxine 5-phosphate synthase
MLLPRLGVNVDHVATVRQARHASYPDPVIAAGLAELAGAGQITVHLREDRRHIQDRDVQLIRQTCQTRLNLEMAATPEMMRFAFEVRPDMVKRYIAELKAAELKVSLFIDPDVEQVQMASRLDADAIELHTGRFCEAKSDAVRKEEHRRLVDAAKTAIKLKLACYAGHGIHYDNVADIASILEIEELNIGHSIVARAVLVGMERAVREMLELARQARQAAIAEARR